MNRNVHVATGVIASSALVLGDEPPETFPQLMALLTAGGLGARLPDVLEPPAHPNHRAFFHSAAFLATVGYGAYKLWQWKPEDEFEKFLKWVGIGFAAGYVSHLLLDASTPKSIPIVC